MKQLPSRSGTPRRSAVRACSATASSTKPEPSNARSPTNATATATESEAEPSTAASSPASASVIGTTAPSKPELLGAVLGSGGRPSPEAETSSSAPAAGRRANAPEVLPPATSTTGTVRSPSEVPSARVLARARAASTSARSSGHRDKKGFVIARRWWKGVTSSLDKPKPRKSGEDSSLLFFDFGGPVGFPS
ncbi:hypothetical protein GW17_00012668 [Ensete ventricosum]|nr:hypothetical protein GW17_00012668 [Ensete ventricosum]